MWGSSVQVGQLQTSSGWDEVTLRRDEKTEDTMIHHELEDESCDDDDSDIHCLEIKALRCYTDLDATRVRIMLR